MSSLVRVLMMAAAILAASAELAGAAGRRLAPSDVVQIKVVNQPELDSQVRVAPDGTLSLPYVGRIRVAGLTEDDVARRVKRALESGNVVLNPQVSVSVTGFGAQVSVLGAVRSPGAIPLDRPTTVLETISRAGGLAQNGGTILIRRRVKNQLQVINLDSKALLNGQGINPYVQNGDEIVVEESPVYYLYGFVSRPGVYPLTRPLSVQQALASGGGLSELGSEWRIEVKRKRRDGTFVVEPVDLDATVNPNDTIIVKERFF